jgi:hypothetical protein
MALAVNLHWRQASVITVRPRTSGVVDRQLASTVKIWAACDTRSAALASTFNIIY